MCGISGFFTGARAVEEEALLCSRELECMEAHSPPYLLAKYVSVDIRGRLFVFGERVAEVTKKLLGNVRRAE